MFKRGTRLQAWYGLQNYTVLVVVTCLLLIGLFSLLFHNEGNKAHSSFGLPLQKWNAFESVKFHPTTYIRNGTDVIWQIPDSPKAVLFLAHGCDGRAANFWDKSPSCPNCVGLPEERLLALHALSRKFAVITISSAGRCWTFGKEAFIVKDIITWWVHNNKLEKLPLVALGASSGGYFVSALANSLSFSSITLMIAEGIFDRMDVTEEYPPTLFVHMPKDLYRKQKISEFIVALKDKGVDVAEVECTEFPLTPSFLADRIPGVDQTVSAKLFALFQEKDFIDGNGYMMKDGRATRWQKALLGDKSIQLDKNLVQYVQEELNLAFALHEMTSLQSEQIFRWFESHEIAKVPL